MTAMTRLPLALLLMTAALPAAAQAPRAGQPPARALSAPASNAPTPAARTVPDRTSQAYGDWVVRCENRPAEGSAPAARTCEMAQGVQNQAQQPVAQIAVGRPTRDQPWRLVVAVPVNILAAAPARLMAEDQGPPVPLQLRICVPTSCMLELELNEPLLRQLRSRDNGVGRVEYKLANEAEMAIPLSFRGFAAAFEALQREPG
jgi:invasion protein IalB